MRRVTSLLPIYVEFPTVSRAGPPGSDHFAVTPLDSHRRTHYIAKGDLAACRHQLLPQKLHSKLRPWITSISEWLRKPRKGLQGEYATPLPEVQKKGQIEHADANILQRLLLHAAQHHPHQCHPLHSLQLLPRANSPRNPETPASRRLQNIHPSHASASERRKQYASLPRCARQGV